MRAKSKAAWRLPTTRGSAGALPRLASASALQGLASGRRSRRRLGLAALVGALSVFWLLAALNPSGGAEPSRSARRAARSGGAAALAAAAADLAAARHPPSAVRAALLDAVTASAGWGGGASNGSAFGAWAGPARGGPTSALSAAVDAIVAGIRTAAPGPPCTWDASLPVSAAAPPGERVLVAADLHDAGAVAPHALLQAAHLAAALPPGSVFLSVYESGSTDDTAHWVGVLAGLAAAMGVPARCVAAGRLTRAPGQGRIEFLAAARNRALEPLWLDPGDPEGWEPGLGAAGAWAGGEGGGAGGGGARANSTPAARPAAALAAALNASSSFTATARSARAAPSSPPSRPRPAGRRGWPATRVLFLNDVFFCAADGARLLAHVASGTADVACGLDFDRPRLQDAPAGEVRALFARRAWRRLKIPRVVAAALAAAAPGRVRKWAAEGTPADDEYQATQPLEFYDIWVARDADGRRFTKAPPHASDPYSVPRATAGLPFPVSCCWNGLVALPAAPFRDAGLRVRAAGPGECAASECSHLCNDLLKLGAGRMLVDPGVRVAYLLRDAVQLHDPSVVRGLAPTTWADVAAAPSLDWRAVPVRPYWEACCLKPGSDMVVWAEDCGWRAWDEPDAYFHRGRDGGLAPPSRAPPPRPAADANASGLVDGAVGHGARPRA